MPRKSKRIAMESKFFQIELPCRLHALRAAEAFRALPSRQMHRPVHRLRIVEHFQLCLVLRTEEYSRLCRIPECFQLCLALRTEEYFHL